MVKRTTMVSPVYMGTVRQGPTTKNIGGVVLTQTNTLAYTDTSAKSMFILPGGATILEIYTDVTTAFNDTGTDQIAIGKSGTANQFVTAQDISSTGRKAGSAAVGAGGFAGWDIGTTDVTVTATYTGQNGNSSAGAARVTVVYTAQQPTAFGTAADATAWN